MDKLIIIKINSLIKKYINHIKKRKITLPLKKRRNSHMVTSLQLKLSYEDFYLKNK